MILVLTKVFLTIITIPFILILWVPTVFFWDMKFLDPGDTLIKSIWLKKYN
jgi:hypothetical protein